RLPSAPRWRAKAKGILTALAPARSHPNWPMASPRPTMGHTMAVSPKPGPPAGDPSLASEPPQASEPRSQENAQEFRKLSGEPAREPDTIEDPPPGVGGPEDPIGLPGAYPCTRGIYSTMYRGRLWTMRQFAGFGTSEETTERFRYLLDHGQTGLSTAF